MPASRSLIALLVGTVVFFALWIVALKPSSSNSGGSSSSQGLGAYQSDINKAKQAVGISNASNAASGNENSAGSTVTPGASSSSGAAATSGAKPAGATATKTTTTKTTTTKTTTTKASTTKPGSHSSAKPAAKSTAAKRTTTKAAAQPATAAQNLSTVRAAMSAHKVVVMLFYNPSASDDLAVKQELGSVSTRRGEVVKLAIPVSQAGSFTALTEQVPVNFTPTLVLIDPSGQASEIAGYSDTFEINQRVADALAAR